MLAAGLFSCSALWSGAAAAQAPVRAESPWTAQARPSLAAASGGATTPSSEHFARPELAVPGAAQKDKETGLTLMIVGGSALVAGLIIGDTAGTILAVGGIGVGAYGLYLYMD
ncbi:MAG: hypothetical protein ACREKI_08225 [Gemmatimonadota bacterium]